MSQQPQQLTETTADQFARVWARHPLASFARHRRQIAFYRQFHALLKAGLGMPTVFVELSKYAPDASLERGLKLVSRDIEGGATLAEALGRRAGLFDDANVELIAFAEEAGTLDPVLASLINHLEQVQKLRWRALFMSLWPMYLLGAFVFVGPLLQAASSMSSSSRGVGALYVSGLVHNLGLMGLVVGSLLAAPFVIKLLNADLAWDQLKRRTPVVSTAVRDLYASRLMLGLSLGVGAGLDVMRALRVAVKSTSSPTLIADLPRAEAAIRQGGTLTQAIESFGLVDRTTLGTLSVAERTGTVDDALRKVSEELQESSLRAVRLLIILVLALVAGVALVGIVSSMLGTLFGPIKTYYDAAGTGKLDGL